MSKKPVLNNNIDNGNNISNMIEGELSLETNMNSTNLSIHEGSVSFKTIMTKTTEKNVINVSTKYVP